MLPPISGQPEPALLPPAQVLIAMQGNQVTIQSTIAPGPQGWEQIRQLCYEGLLVAQEQVVKAKLESGGSRLIEVPALGFQRVMGG